MTGPATATAAPFRVLHVCTGNICRSPLAEHLMRAGLRARLGDEAERFVVSSAGTWGHTGAPMEPHALTVLGERGLDGAAFRAQELVAEQVAAADLVLGATREHRASAVVLVPRAARRCFTLREFARLLTGVDVSALPVDPVERLRALVAAAAAARGTRPPGHPADDDVVDPYHAPLSAFAATARTVEEALQTPLGLLAPVRSHP